MRVSLKYVKFRLPIQFRRLPTPIAQVALTSNSPVAPKSIALEASPSTALNPYHSPATQCAVFVAPQFKIPVASKSSALEECYSVTLVAY